MTPTPAGTSPKSRKSSFPNDEKTPLHRPCARGRLLLRQAGGGDPGAGGTRQAGSEAGRVGVCRSGRGAPQGRAAVRHVPRPRHGGLPGLVRHAGRRVADDGGPEPGLVPLPRKRAVPPRRPPQLHRLLAGHVRVHEEVCGGRRRRDRLQLAFHPSGRLARDRVQLL